MDIHGGVAGGVAKLSYPSFKNLYHTRNGFFPSHRWILKASVWNYQTATNYDRFQLVHCDYLIENTHRPEINFQVRTLNLEIPGTDWLNRPANNDLALRYDALLGGVININQPQLFLRRDFESFNFIVRNGLSAPTMTYVQLMDDMFHRLGHAQGEVIKLAQVLLNVWREERKRRRKRYP
jgi:hypothetical protein